MDLNTIHQFIFIHKLNVPEVEFHRSEVISSGFISLHATKYRSPYISVLCTTSNDALHFSATRSIPFEEKTIKAVQNTWIALSVIWYCRHQSAVDLSANITITLPENVT